MCQDLGSILFYEQVHICHCPVSCLPHLTICAAVELLPSWERINVVFLIRTRECYLRLHRAWAE